MPNLRIQYCYEKLTISVKHIKQAVLISADDSAEFLV